MQTTTEIPPLSVIATKALDKEVQKAAYRLLDEETAHYEAAKELVKREKETGEVIFDITNPADNILLALVHMD